MRSAAMMILVLTAPAAEGGPLPSLRWTGTAQVHSGERIVAIEVDTLVRPFRDAVSKSRLAGEPEDRTRTMTISAEGGSVAFQGASRVLTRRAAEHERQQFALYGLMLTTHARGRCITARHDLAPATKLCFDARGALETGANSVPDPETGRPIAQTFRFYGEQRSGGVRWPIRMTISQEGRPYFDITFATFQVSRGGLPSV